jgi:hypothetical protein
MRKLIPLIAIALLLSAAACKRNLCEGVVCNNGGSCVDGNCHCLPAWTGVKCDVHTNPCDTTPCYNGGSCNNGVCSCPGHTSGPDCSIQEDPTYMYVYRIAIGQFCPASSTGGSWDSDGTAADIYPVIKRGSTVVFDGSVNYRRDNANYTTWYPMVLGNDSLIINDITNPDYRIELWDYDGGGGADTYMDGFNFTPYSHTGGFPGSFTSNDTAFYHNKFELHVYWNYVW